MNGMRCVPDQRNPAPYIIFGVLCAERECAPRAVHPKLAECEIRRPGQHFAKFFVAALHCLCGLVRCR